MSQMILQARQTQTPKPLVENAQSQDGTKWSTLGLSWEDFQGLSWICEEEL